MKTSGTIAKAKGRQRMEMRKKRRTAQRRFAHLRSLSSIEGKVAGISELKRLAGKASMIAAEKAMMVGLPKVYATNTEVIKETSGGDKTVIAHSGSKSKSSQNGFFVKYQKGTILHATRK
jgi:hypothetical protein